MSIESTQWRKFLQPVVTGLVALMAAGVRHGRKNFERWLNETI